MTAIKTFILVLIAVTCLTPALVVKEAQAAPAWYTVWVNAAGQENAGKYATVTDATGTVPTLVATKMTLSPTYDAKALLNTAKAAMQTKMQVQISADLAVTPLTITALYLLDH